MKDQVLPKPRVAVEITERQKIVLDRLRWGMKTHVIGAVLEDLCDMLESRDSNDILLIAQAIINKDIRLKDFWRKKDEDRSD